MQSDTSRDNCYLVAIRLAYHLAATNGKLLIRAIYHWCLFTGRAHVNDTVMVRHFSHQLCSLVGITGIEYRATKDGTHHRKVLQRHLRRAIFTNRDTGVGTTETNIGTGDRSHTDEVIGTSEERREGRGKRNLLAHAHTDGSRHHLLLGNILLKVAIGVGLGKF